MEEMIYRNEIGTLKRKWSSKPVLTFPNNFVSLYEFDNLVRIKHIKIKRYLLKMTPKGHFEID